MGLVKFAKLRIVDRDISKEYTSVIKTANTITGDNVVVNSHASPELPVSVAKMIKDRLVEKLSFNGNDGIKATSERARQVLSKINPAEFIFFRARAIDACGFEVRAGSIPPEGNNPDLAGPNANGDYFSAEELLKLRTHEGSEIPAFATFVGVPFFTNHENQDINKAKGTILNAYYDLKDQTVYCDCMVDRKAYAHLARGIETGYITDVSMGTAVGYSLCSICGNKASTPQAYCTHIKTAKGRKVAGRLCYEINHDLKFIELSGVVDGACEKCTIQSMLDPQEILQAASSVSNRIHINAEFSECQVPRNLKSADSNLIIENFDAIRALTRYALHAKEMGSPADATTLESIVANYDALIEAVLKYQFASDSGLVKTSSKEDLQALYEALQKLKEVTVKIINSEDVDYEFVEDIAKVLAALQNLIVDLAEAGFGDLGGQQGGAPGGAPAGGAPAAGGAPGGASMSGQAFPMPMASQNNEMTKVATVVDELFDKITRNAGSGTFGEGIFSKDSEVSKKMTRALFAKNWDKALTQETEPMKSTIEVSDGDYSLRVAGNTITAFHAGQKVKEASVDALDVALANGLKTSATAVTTAEVILKALIEGSGISQEALKTSVPPVNEVQEGQIGKMDGNFGRKRPEGSEENLNVAETRLDDIPVSAETGTMEFLLNGKTTSTGKDRFERQDVTDRPVRETELEESNKRIHNAQAPADKGITQDQLRTEKIFTTQPIDKDISVTTEAQLNNESPTQPADKERWGYALNEVQEGQLSNKRLGDDVLRANAGRALEILITAAARSVIERGISTAQAVDAFAALAKDFKPSFQTYAKAIQTTDACNKLYNRLANKTASSQTTRRDLVGYVMDRVANHFITNPASDKDFLAPATPFLAAAAIKLAASPTVAETAVRNEVEAIFTRMREAATGKSNVRVAEDQVSNALDEALSKRAGVHATASNSDSEIVRYHVDDVNNISIDSPDFDKVAKAALADILTDAGIVATASTVTILNTIQESADELVSTVRVAQPNAAQLKVAKLRQTLRQVAQTPPAGSQFGGGGDTSGGGAGMDGGAPGGGVGAMSAPPPAVGAPPTDAGAPTEDPAGAEEDSTPVFPGERCILCGSKDVEEVDSAYQCKKCGTEFEVEVEFKTKLKKSVLDGSGAPADDAAADPMGGGETGMAPVAQPMAPPAGGQMGYPATASFKLHPKLMLTTAESQGRLPELGEAFACGQRCPNCVSPEVCFENDNGICTACGADYTVKVSRNEQSPEVLDVKVSWIATPISFSDENCESCKAAKNRFAKRIEKIASASTERISKYASRNDKNTTLKEAFNLCIQDRQDDGFSRSASTHICGCTKASFENQVMKKKAQFGAPEEEEKDPMEAPQNANGTGNLKPNPLKDIDGIGGDAGIEEANDADIPVSEIGSASDDGSSFEDDNGFKDNLPGGDIDGGNKIKLNIEVSKSGDGCPTCGNEEMFDNDSSTCGGCGSEHIELSIDTETGTVEVSQNEHGTESDDVTALESTDTDSVIDEIAGDETGEGDPDEVEITSLDPHDEVSGESGGRDSISEDDSSEDDSSEESQGEESGTDTKPDFVKEGDDDRNKVPALAMSSSRITKTASGIGSGLDMNMLIDALGLTAADVNAQTEAYANRQPFDKTAGQVKLARTPNMLTAAFSTPAKTAQTSNNGNKPTAPLSVEKDVDAGVPRDESKGLKQTEPKDIAKVIKKDDNNEHGSTERYTDVVPRASGDDGLGGDKTTYETENSDSQTSGNPDTYVQTLQEQVKPKSGVHANAASEILKQYANANNVPANQLEIGDFGPFYLMAHNERVFQIDKDGYNGPAFKGNVVANFSKVRVTVKANGDVEKVIKSAGTEDVIKPTPQTDPSKHSKPSPKAGQHVKPNPASSPENHSQTSGSKVGVKTAEAAANAVAKKLGTTVANLEVGVFADRFGVMDLTTKKLYAVPKI